MAEVSPASAQGGGGRALPPGVLRATQGELPTPFALGDSGGPGFQHPSVLAGRHNGVIRVRSLGCRPPTPQVILQTSLKPARGQKGPLATEGVLGTVLGSTGEPGCLDSCLPHLEPLGGWSLPEREARTCHWHTQGACRRSAVWLSRHLPGCQAPAQPRPRWLPLARVSEATFLALSSMLLT